MVSVARVLLKTLITLWLASVIAFVLVSATAADPARLVLAAGGLDPTPEEVAAKRAELGLDDAAPVRYARWLGAALQGDFGASFRTGQPVQKMYAERVPATVLLAICSLLLTTLLALPLGLLAAVARQRGWRLVVQAMSVIGAAVPGFWLALLLIFAFSAQLRWLPSFGNPTPAGLVLPTIVLAIPHIALQSRLVRAAVLDVLSRQHVLAARASGASGGRLLMKHVLPVAAPVLASPLALEAAYLLTGTVIVERVFAYPGVGRLAVDAALIGDMPVLSLCVLVAALAYLIANAAADLLAGWLDPRLRAA
jgi:peptide/nickel transport system permease protein